MKKNKIHMKRFGIPIKRKGKCRYKTILLIIVLISIFAVVSIGVQSSIKNSIENLDINNDLNATWIGSLASYWGGIIGGIISGSLTVVGVAWTIKYYRDSDAVKSRIEHMPFLIIEMEGCTDEEENGDVTNGVKIYEVRSRGINNAVKNNINSEKKILYYRMKLHNIGRGFANTLVFYTGGNLGGEAYNELIQVNDSGEFCLKIHVSNNIYEDEIRLGVLYIDCMTNEYVQSYTIQWKSENFNDIKVENGYPSFIEQTHSIGR